MKLLKQVNYIFDYKQKIKLFFLLILIFIGSVLELLGVSAILPLVNVAMKPDSIYKNKYYLYIANIFHLDTVTNFIIFFAVILCALYIIKNAFLIFSRNIQLEFSYNMQRKVSLRLMKCYLQQDYLFHVSHNVAELQRNINSDVKQFFMTIATIMNLMIEAMTCLLLIGMLLITDVITTGLITGIFTVATLIFWFTYKKMQVSYGKQNRETAAELYKWLLQSFGGIKEIKVMNREQFFIHKYDSVFKKNTAANKKYNVTSMLPKYVMETICICSLLIVMCVRIQQGTPIEEFVSVLSVFAVAAMRMLPSFNRITEGMSTILFNKAGVDSVFHDLKEAERLEQKQTLQKSAVNKLPLLKEIKVENLYFRYPNTEKNIFEDAFITIEKNKSIAFIGSSGAGKTTLADIIIGVLEPDEGKVFVDDCDVFAHLDAWHKTIGYIPQMIYLMDDTIRSNIVFGLAEEEIDDKKVWKALEWAELSEFVQELEKGIYTEIGDRGVRLSGGQRQRIGIARALYAEPEVLILDEATSALDNETEAAVMESIESLRGKTTLIIIAHRLSTIKNCDMIFEVGNGKITLKQSIVKEIAHEIQ